MAREKKSAPKAQRSEVRTDGPGKMDPVAKRAARQAIGRKIGGSAGIGGFDFQARVAAYVAAHILARRPLKWLDGTVDIPVAIEAETGRGGDDLRITLADPNVAIEVQAKRGLNGEAKVTAALSGFVRDLRDTPSDQAVLAVDPRTHVSIASNFALDLDRLRQGRTDIGTLTSAVLARLQQDDAEWLCPRLHVVQLALQTRHAGDQKAAIAWLSLVVGDEIAAEGAWRALVEDGHVLVRDRGRRDRPRLEQCLAAAHVPIVPSANQVGARPSEPSETLELVRRIAAAQGVLAAPAEALSLGARAGADERWHAQVDAARDLITGQQPTAALQLLDAIVPRVEAAAVADDGSIHDVRVIKRRIFGNRASALIQLGMLDEAQAAVRVALEHDPENSAVLTIAARIAVLQHDPQAAARLARRALVTAPDDASAWAILVEIGHVAVSVPVLGEVPPGAARYWVASYSTQAKNEVPIGLRLNPTVLTSAGLRALNLGKLGEAAQLLRAAADVGNRTPASLSLLAFTLMASARDAGESREPDALGEDRLVEAERLLSEALAAFDSAGFSVMFEELLLARASALRALHRPDAALVDARRALALDPRKSSDRWRAVFLTASLLLDLGQSSAAAEEITNFETHIGVRDEVDPAREGAARDPSILPTDATIPWAILRARLAAAVGDSQGVRTHLQTALTAAETEARASGEFAAADSGCAHPSLPAEPAGGRQPSLLKTSIIAAECALDAGLLDYAVEIVTTYPSERAGWIYWLLMARIALAQADAESAWASFERAASVARARGDYDAARRIHIEHAAARGRAGAYDEAIREYEAGDAWTLGDAARPGYVAALIASGRADVARDRLDEIEREGPLPAWALSAAAGLAEARDDLDGAIPYLRALWHARPEVNSAGLRLATVYARLGRQIEAVGMLRQLALRHDLTGEERMLVAHRLFEAGEHDEALEQAFLATRFAADDAEIAQLFVDLAVRHDQRGAKYAPVRVGPDTQVELERVRKRGKSKEVVRFLILREGPVDSRRNEFLATDNRVARLLGKTVGDTVTFRRGQVSEASYRVARIVSAIAATFQDIIRTFPERFPDSVAVQRFEEPDEPSVASMLPMIAMLHRQAAQEERALAVYDETPLPVGSLAVALRVPTHRVCGLLASRSRAYLTEFGDERSRHHALRAAAAGRFVVTRTALWTCAQLAGWGTPILEPLSGLAHQALVPRSLLEELEDELREAREPKDGLLGDAVAAPTGMRLVERSEEAATKYAQVLAEVVAWVREQRIMARPEASLTVEGRDLRRLVGNSAADAIELARAHGAALFTDDLVLRRMAVRGTRTEGFSTWALVQVLRARGILSDDQARRTVVNLLHLKHYFVAVDAELLHGVLRDNAYAINADVSLALDTLAGTDVVLESAAIVVADLLRAIALDPIGAGVLVPVTQACIARLTVDRRVSPTLRVLERAVLSRLELLPLTLERVQDAMRRFEESKVRAGALT